VVRLRPSRVTARFAERAPVSGARETEQADLTLPLLSHGLCDEYPRAAPAARFKRDTLRVDKYPDSQGFSGKDRSDSSGRALRSLPQKARNFENLRGGRVSPLFGPVD